MKDWIVMKFGGTSLSDEEGVMRAARHVMREVGVGLGVIAVTSARGGETDDLEELARRYGGEEAPWERDVLLATGEQASAALLAMRLCGLGVRARSWQGWQAGLTATGGYGSAWLGDWGGGECGGGEWGGEELRASVEGGEVAVVTGFQGIGEGGRVKTLGRGGSDMTAVCLAAGLGATRCDVYTDVEGVYTADPRIVGDARRLDRISFEEMLEASSLGAGVMQARAMAYAAQRGIRVRVRSSFRDPCEEQGEREDPASRPGTLICTEEEMTEERVVSGVAYSRGEAKMTLHGVKDEPGVAGKIFGGLAEAGVSVDMIVQSASHDMGKTDITFTLAESDVERARGALDGLKGEVEYSSLSSDAGVAKVSVVGLGMRLHAGVARVMFEALGREGVNVEAISTSEIRVSVLVAEKYVELAVRTLHEAYGLEKVR